MSGHAVRQQFFQQFRDLSVNTRRVSIMIVASYLFQLIGAIGFGYWLLQSPVSLPTGLGLVVLMFFIGTRLRGFNNILHECTHFAFSRRREDNVVFGSICASLILGCFRDYRDEHLTHHAHLGDYDRDLDLKRIRDFRLEDPLTPKTVLRHALTPLFCLHFPHYFKVDLSGRDGKPYRALKIGLIVAAIVFLALDPLAALLLVWVPFVWVYSTINYWMDCVDHAGLVDGGDELDTSRNLSVLKLLRVVFFPRNDCFHLIHHLFPQVPTHHLDACHARLLTHPDYLARTEGSSAQTAIGDWKMVKAVDKHAV